MSERMDDLAKSVAERTSRRSALAGVGALALGALGIDHAAEAADNPCQKCKKKCKRNNRKKGKKNPTNCSKKCRNKC